MRSWLFSVVIGVALSLAGPQQRDPDVAPTPASGRISGVVQTVDPSPVPVRQAVVRLTEGVLGLTFDAVTDDGGRFSFDRLPDGRYALAATRPSFVSIAFGATRPGWPGSALVLTKGQHLTDLRVLLARGAVITGVVRDAIGVPIVDADVAVTNVLPQMRRTTVVRTNDRGRFRAYGLPAGPYVVSARPLQAVAFQAMSDADVDAALQELQQRRIGSVLPGPPRAAPRPAADEPARRLEQTERLADIYFPEAVDQEAADIIRVRSGEERGDIDIVLRSLRVGSIAGHVTDGPAVRPLRVDVVRKTAAAGSSIAGDIQLDGAFRVNAVTPGSHTVLAWSATNQACRFASQDVVVDGQAVDRMHLALRACPEVVGRIGWAGGAASAMPLSSLRVVLTPPAGSAPASRFPPRTAAVDVDGRFRFGVDAALLPGPYRIEIAGPAGDASSMLTSLTVDGIDVLDAPFVVRSDVGSIVRLEGVLSERQSALSGRLETSSGAPTTHLILAFTTNAEWWRNPFRRVRVVRPSADGQFAFEGLPAGDYYLAALTEVAPDEWRDPSFLSEAVRDAIRVTVVEGAATVQNLRVRGQQSREGQRPVLPEAQKESMQYSQGWRR